MEPAEWAQSQIENMQAKRDAEARKEEVFLERQKLVKAHAVDLWQAVIQAFQEHCEEYNRLRLQDERSLGFHCVNRHLCMLRRDGGWSEVTVGFNPSTHVIRVKANNCVFDETYKPKPLTDGEVVLYRRGQFPVTSNDVAQAAIGAFLKGREFAESM